jgi:prevent-host-death family protein
MKRVSITEAKNRLSALIDSLKGGSPVLIVDRGRPVARLEPVRSSSQAEDDGRMTRLVREGIVRPGRAALSRSFVREQLPRVKPTRSVVAAILEERQEGR